MRISDWSSDVCSSDLRVLISPSLTWRPGADTQFSLIGLYQRDTSASSQQFLPLVSTILATSDARRIDNRPFLGDPDYDQLKQPTASETLIADHQFPEEVTISERARYNKRKHVVGGKRGAARV